MKSFDYDDDDISLSSSVSSDIGQFQVQIVVTPARGVVLESSDIKVSGSTMPRLLRSGSTRKLLPSIHNSQETQWISKRSNISASMARSRYHHSCYDSCYLEPKLARRSRASPARSGSNGSRNEKTPISKYDVDTGHDVRQSAPSMSPAQITGESVAQYLRSHPDFLERYVLSKDVDLEQLEKWAYRKSVRSKSRNNERSARRSSLLKCQHCGSVDARGTPVQFSKRVQELSLKLQEKPGISQEDILWKLSSYICLAVGAEKFKLYLSDHGNNKRIRKEPDNGKIVSRTTSQNISNGPSHVESIESLKISTADEDLLCHKEDKSQNVFCQPIYNSRKQLHAVLELWRHASEPPFTEDDKEIVSSYLAWGRVALIYADLYVDMSQQKDLNHFLQEVAQSIFQDMISMDVLVKKIMNFAQKLVDADRASLFLVDEHTQELYATIFDIGIESAEKDEEIMVRFPVGKGIAGIVAKSGNSLNIVDAYKDERFNSDIDNKTGYKTQTILCMPIFIKHKTIGVVQMVNKRFGSFTKQDEENFKVFAVYCGLALHHAQLYDEIKKSEQKYKVALEVLSYHNTCNEEEVRTALSEEIPENLHLDDYYFNPFQLEDYEKAKHAVYMFKDLFGLERFDKDSLLRFTLTVKKNYRRLPYHNWTHGFSVAHCMYTIIKRSDKTFTYNERLALYIGALCHDLDHRGKNNKFMLDTASPLANIYSTSTMEHHHFNQTVTILQQEGHNIFSKLTSEEYKEVLGLLKHCILATDLALFFDNKKHLSIALKAGSFSPANAEHRMLMQAIAMTGSDLSASAKPWDTQCKTVKIIFEEFYDQGDAERAAGRVPIPMMDRNQQDQQPASQVGFLKGICTPCYSLLHEIIPGTKDLLTMCENNLRKWEEKVEEYRE